MNEILIATKNQGKAKELAALLTPLAPAISLAQWEAAHQTLAEPVEDGQSFIDNAEIKARYYARATGLCTLADDSGLSVAVLRGRPGIHSARFGGPGLNDQGRNDYLLKALAETGARDRGAWFTSVLALARPDGLTLNWAGEAHGLIALAPRGENGFGYDPLFYYPPLKRTFAQLSPEEKNQKSHRAAAASLFAQDLDRVRRFLNHS